MKHIFNTKLVGGFFTYISHVSIFLIPMANPCYKGFQHILDLISKIPEQKIE